MAELRQTKQLPEQKLFEGVSPAIASTLKKLDQPTKLDFVNLQLSELTLSLEEILEIPIHLDRLSFENEGIDIEEAVTFESSPTDKITYRVVLDNVLDQLSDSLLTLGSNRLTWYVMDGGAVNICFQEDLRWGLPVRAYDVSGILGQSYDKLEPQWLLAQEFIRFIEESVSPLSWRTVGGYGSISSIGDSFSVKNYSQVQRRIRRIFEQIRKIQSLQAPQKWVTLSEQEQLIETILNTNSSTDVELLETPLFETTDYLANQYGFRIRTNEAALGNFGIGLDSPVMLVHSNINLLDTLELVCAEIDPELVFVYTDGFFMLTTFHAIEKRTESLIFNVADLLKEHPPGTLEQQEKYEEDLRKKIKSRKESEESTE